MKGRINRNRKSRKCNRHHLTPKSRGGSTTQSNLLTIEMKRHCAWHVLWGNRTLDEGYSLTNKTKISQGEPTLSSVFLKSGSTITANFSNNYLKI